MLKAVRKSEEINRFRAKNQLARQLVIIVQNGTQPRAI
jgi:hypothetical protein